jgi:hypothetical protein
MKIQKILSWIISLISAACLAFSILFFMRVQIWQIGASMAALVAAILLVFPPLWRSQNVRQGWVRLAVAVLLMFGANLIPIPTHAVLVTFPAQGAW